MSNTSETEKKDNAKKSEVMTKVIWALVGFIIGVVAAFGIFTATLGQTAKEAEKELTALKEEQAIGGITTYTYDHTVLEDEDATTVASQILNKIGNIKNNSTYIQVQVGDNEYESYMYNKNNECFAESSDGTYISVFRNDGKTVKFGGDAGAIAVGKDIDVMTITENAMKAVSKKVDGVQLFEMTPTKENPDVTEYRVDFVGEEAVKQLYISENKQEDRDFADLMVNNMKEHIGDWEPHIILVCALSNNSENENDFMMYCMFVQNNQEYTNWVMLGNIVTDDWKLDEAWYTTDFANTDANEFSTLMNDTVTKLGDILDKYAKENGLDQMVDTEASITESPTDVINDTLESLTVDDGTNTLNSESINENSTESSEELEAVEQKGVSKNTKNVIPDDELPVAGIGEE